MSDEPEPPVLGLAETERNLVDGRTLARKLAVSRDTIRRLTRSKAIPHVYVGQQVRFDVPEVLRALRDRAARLAAAKAATEKK